MRSTLNQAVVSPSRSDIFITKKLRQVLELADCDLLDHIIIGADSTYSMSDKGRI